MEVSENPRNLLICSDDNYVCHLATAVESVLYNRKTNYPISVHIISDNISRKNKKILEKHFTSKANVCLDFKDNPKGFENASADGHLTLGTYLRLRAPELFPECDKMLYIDCDVIARDDLKELFDVELKNNYLAANPAVDFRKHAKAKGGIGYDRLVQDLGFTYEQVCNYVGAGVIVMNLKLMRDDNIVPKFEDYIIAHGNEPRFIEDQETLNVVCQNKIIHYHPRFHHALTHLIDREQIEAVLVGEEVGGFDEAMKNPAVVHFCGTQKPWHSGACPYKRDYWKYRNQTPWGSFFKRIFL